MMNPPIPTAWVKMRLTVTGTRSAGRRAFGVLGQLDGILVNNDRLELGLYLALPNRTGGLSPFRIVSITKIPAPPQSKLLVVDVQEGADVQQWEAYVGNCSFLNAYSLEDRYPCPCCFYLGLTEQPPGSFEICDVCGWEDDDVQLRNPTYTGGANGRLSLKKARQRFEESIEGAELSELPRYPDYFEHTFPS
jgi:hypothetical protein